MYRLVDCSLRCRVLDAMVIRLVVDCLAGDSAAKTRVYVKGSEDGNS